ncbi:MAG: PQQ-binding-like beta-propeller repeat protein [Candidatus Eisenbacteria bacterium]|nr:PQQ-binding-like beta-propeller repeat protein [Candidatus Eisenbacteria bacterium]
MKLAASNGDILWRVHAGGPAGLADRGWDIAVGPDGHPVVTGVLTNAADPGYFCTIKFNTSNGSEIWNRKILGAVNSISARAGWLAVCDDGDIVMANRTWTTSTSYDVVLHRYAAADGATAWAIQHNSSGTSPDDPRDMVRDAAGDILVAGIRSGNYMVLKFDRSDGHLFWSGSYNGPIGGYDGASAIVEGPGGVVVATGFSDGQGTNWDAATVGFDPESGAQLWAERFDAGDAQSDEGHALAASAQGDLYVAGYGDRFATGSDMLALRYRIENPTGIDARPLAGESGSSLRLSAHPTPFVDRVFFSLEMPRAGIARVAVYDARGRRTGVLFEGALPRGAHDLVWDGRDAGGRPLAAGVYFVRFETEDARAVRKLILSR